MTLLVKCLLWFNAIGCGLLAGVYLAFSVFIMNALGRVEPSQAISVMNAINSTILRSSFMPFFIGTTAASAVLAAIALFRSSAPGAPQMLIAGLLYIAGMCLCTILFNVPLNNFLTAVQPAAAGAATSWADYRKRWTFWNHVRTVSSAVACVLYISALTANL